MQEIFVNLNCIRRTSVYSEHRNWSLVGWAQTDFTVQSNVLIDTCIYIFKFIVVDAVIQNNHVLDGSELNVRKHILPQAEATYHKQGFVSGFSIKTSEETFRNYLEAMSRIDVDKIVYGDIESTAIVLFKEQPGRFNSPKQNIGIITIRKV